MNKKQAIDIFKSEYLPSISKTDKPAIRQEWGIFTDMLCKNNQITLRQYETWHQPTFCK